MNATLSHDKAYARKANDLLRRCPFNSAHGRFAPSPMIQTLSLKDQARCLATMMLYNQFDANPNDEHDHGEFEVLLGDGSIAKLAFRIQLLSDQSTDPLSAAQARNSETRVLSLAMLLE